MIAFDSGARFDAGQRFDATLNPTPRAMAQIKLAFKDKTPEELLGNFTEIIDALTGNASFTTPNPTLAALSTARDSLADAIQDVKAKENTWRAAVAGRDVTEDAAVLLFTQLSAYVQNASGGDEAKILSSGFQVRSAPVPVVLTPPQDVRASLGDNSGEIDLAWDRVRGAASYIVEYREHTDSAPWQSGRSTTRSATTLTGLTPGTSYAFRVRAVGAQGEGPWSDETVKRAV